MGRMMYLIMAIIAVQLMLYFVFDSGIPTTSLWDLFKNPTNWDSLSFTSLIFDTILAVGAIAFVGGLIFKNDLIVFGGLAGILLTFGKQLVNMYQQIASQSFFGDATSAPIVASIITGSIIFLYIFTVIDFWRGRD